MMKPKAIVALLPIIISGAIEIFKLIVDLVKTADKAEAQEPPAPPEAPIPEKKKEEDHDESY